MTRPRERCVTSPDFSLQHEYHRKWTPVESFHLTSHISSKLTCRSIFTFKFGKRETISLYQFDFNSLWSISSDLGDLARSFKTGLKKTNVSLLLHFLGPPLFFLLSVTFVRTKTTGVDFTLYPVLYEKEMAFICVLIILGDPGAACLHYEQSLFSSKIRGEERRTRAARSVGVGTVQSRSQSRSHTRFAFVPLLPGYC